MSDILDTLAEKLDCHHYGHYLAVRCLFHDDTRPSLMIYEDYYHCLSCDAKGKTSTLLNKLDNTTLLFAKTKPDYRNPWSRWTREQSLAKVLKHSWQTLTSQPSLGNYLTNRKILPEHQKALGIGYREDWYTIPIRNPDGKIAGAVARANAETNPAKAKYVIPFGQSPNLLYVPSWKRVCEQSEIYLTFGILDAVSLWILGYASMSTTAGKRIEPSAFNDIRKKIIIVPDQGEESSAHQLARQLGWRGFVKRINYPDGTKDINDIYRTFPKDVWEKEYLGAWK